MNGSQRTAGQTCRTHASHSAWWLRSNHLIPSARVIHVSFKVWLVNYKQFFISHYWFLFFCHSSHTSTCSHVLRSQGLKGDMTVRQGQISFNIHVASTESALRVRKTQQRKTLQACFHGGIRCSTLVRIVWNVSTLQTLTTSRYIHENRSPMSDLISFLYDVMSAVKYSRMRCQSTRRGCKIIATDALV